MLKGAMLLRLWVDRPHRPTRNLGLLAATTPTEYHDLDQLHQRQRTPHGGPRWATD